MVSMTQQEQEFNLSKIYDYSTRIYVDSNQPLCASNVLAQQLGKEAVQDCLEQMTKWPKFNSAHEAYAVLLEEVDELWEEVRKKQKNRDVELMKKEALQVAAMAIRFAAEICNEEVIRK